MPLSQVSWVDSNGDTRKGLLLQFVHASMDGTYGMILCFPNKIFYKVPYEKLTFEKWMD